MKPNTPSNSLFSIALGLEFPWYVEDVKLLDKPESSSKELQVYVYTYIHIYIYAYIHVNFRRGHEFVLLYGHSGNG